MIIGVAGQFWVSTNACRCHLCVGVTMIGSCAVQLSLRASRQGSQVLFKNARLSVRSNVFKTEALQRDRFRCISTSVQSTLNRVPTGYGRLSLFVHAILTIHQRIETPLSADQTDPTIILHPAKMVRVKIARKQNP